MAKTKKKSTPRKTVWNDEGKLFGEKSKIIDLDLPQFFSSPEAWTALDEAEKDQLRALLPPHVELDEDGSIPQGFLKYDLDWRNALHQFQVDLEAGRYDPAWLAEAALAMEERAAGVFDSFKETEFEEFWGQKQKVKVHLSGETASLKLADLIRASLFEVGDIWSYTRKIGKPKSERIQVEKECMVTAIMEDSLTFVIPSGRSKFITAEHYLKHCTATDRPSASPQTSQLCPNTFNNDLAGAEAFGLACNGALQSSLQVKCDMEAVPSGPTIQSQKTHPSQASRVPLKRLWTDCNSISSTLQLSPMTDGAVASVPTETGCQQVSNMADDESMREARYQETSLLPSNPRSSPLSTAASSPLAPIETQLRPRQHEQGSPTDHSDGELLHQTASACTLTITTPGALETKIIEIDGQIRNAPAVNSWRNFRVRRREQDIGSLWEIREEYWVNRRPE